MNKEFTMEGAISRCAGRGLLINSVIDVGASNGSWSIICMKHFPKAQYLLIEAQSPHEPGLIQFKKEFPNSDYILAAAADKEGSIFFLNNDLMGGVASHSPFQYHNIEVQSVTINSEIKKRNLPPPYLIKLDTHGFEIPILEGSSEYIKDTNLFIIETYNYSVTPKYYEMCKYMEEKGFLTIEIADLHLREKDNSFWQMDTFFIPSNSKEFEYKGYR